LGDGSIRNLNRKLEDGSVAEKRRLIVNAAMSLALSERKVPTPEGLAEKSGLSVLDVNELFPTLDDLGDEIRTIAAGLYQNLDDAMPRQGSLSIMLAELVDLRATFYETAGDLRILGDAAEQFLPSIAQARAIRDGRYRATLASLFSDQFDDPNSETLSKIEFATSWESWRHLRVVQRLSVDQAKDVIRSVLDAVASQDR